MASNPYPVYVTEIRDPGDPGKILIVTGFFCENVLKTPKPWFCLGLA